MEVRLTAAAWKVVQHAQAGGGRTEASHHSKAAVTACVREGLVVCEEGGVIRLTERGQEIADRAFAWGGAS